MKPTTRLVLIGLVLAASIFFLWPTFRFYQLDGVREPLASKVRNGKATHADSLALHRWDSLNGDAYKDAAAGRIKLGLDLRGGMNITMEVDAVTLLEESAQADAVDPVFQQVIEATRKDALTSDDPVIDIFTRNFDRIARPAGKTLLNYYDVGTLGADAGDEEIVAKLSRNIEDAIDQAMQVIGRRIDQYGVAEQTITRQANRRISVELPGVSDESGVRSLLSTTARLEFKLVRNDAATANLFGRIDRLLAGKITSLDTVKPAADTTIAADTTASGDSTLADADTTRADTNKPVTADTAKKSDTSTNPYEGLSEEETKKRYQSDHPFTSLFMSQIQLEPDGKLQDIAFLQEEMPTGEYYFYVPRASLEKVRAILRRDDVRGAIPEDLIIGYSADPEFPAEPGNPESDLFALYGLTRESELTGEVITDAYPSFEQGRPMVLMQMNSEGADRWAAITGKNIKKRVAIVLDSAVYSAPVVQNKIPNGSSQITGSSDAAEANLLAVVLKAGALKAPVRIIEERVVGPSLGEDSINKGVFSTIVGAALVFLFMLMYYRYGGLIAVLALLLNVLITIALLAAFQATLTLPGIGGLVLTIGMAVDGNILIYERIREELAAGRPLARAIQVGYDKAWSAVLDTHITTLISGAILYFFGSGPVQGFAITLMIGLTATFFTAVFVTRTVFNLNTARGAETLDFGQGKTPVVEAAAAR